MNDMKMPYYPEKSRFRSIIDIFISALSVLRKPVVALPALIYFLLHIGVMAAYLYIGSSVIHEFWSFFAGGIGPEIFRHYPHHIIMMQIILGRFDIFLDIFVHIVIQGATVLLAGSVLTAGKANAARAFSGTFSRYPHLLAVSVISSGAIFLIINLSEIISSALLPQARLISAAGSVILALAVQAVFVYTIPFILIERENAFAAIRRSFSLAIRYAWMTILLVSIPFVLTLPSVLLDIKADMIAFRLSPDFIIYNHAVGELLQTIATYLITAGSVVIVIRYSLNLPEKS